MPKESKVIEDRLPKTGVPKLKRPKVPAAGGTDAEPSAPEAYTAEDSSSSCSNESSPVDEDDMTLGGLKRRKDEEARLICGARAVVHNLTNHHAYNERVVTIENWISVQEMYEARGAGMDNVLLVPRQNLKLIDDEDASRDRVIGERIHVHVQMLDDGVTRVVDGRHYRQTANGRWREVNKTYGDVFKSTSKKTGRSGAWNVEHDQASG